MNALEKLQADHIPTDSAVHAIAYLSQNGILEGISEDDLRYEIVNLTGHEASNDASPEELNFTYRYVVNGIVTSKGTKKGKELFDEATTKAKDYLAKNPHVFAKKDPVTSNLPPKLDACGNPKKKKGAKKELAKKVYREQILGKNLTRPQAIQIIMDEVGMSSGGASTYYANLKSGKM